MADDPFEDVLNLEELLYQEGYSQGTTDGLKAGKVEGRSLGLAKGFEKFLESGKLHGKAVVWANRLPRVEISATVPSQMSTEASNDAQQPDVSKGDPMSTPSHRLAPLPSNPRLEKNITSLFAMVEPETLSTQNTDEAVNDFDDRIKRAQGKSKIISRIIGETPPRDPASPEVLSEESGTNVNPPSPVPLR